MSRHLVGGSQRRERLVEAIEEDTSLHSFEKETIIRFSKVDDHASVYTEQAEMMRPLLRHPRFEVKSLRVTIDDTVSRQVAPNDFEEGSITGVDGTIPREALTVQKPL